MKRRLFTLTAILSLTLCLACLGLWVRSEFVVEYLHKGFAGGCEMTCWSTDGTLRLVFLRFTPPPATSPATPWRWRVSHDGVPRRANPIAWSWTYPWYQARTSTVGSSGIASFRAWILPYWLLTLATAALPGLWFWRWRKEKRLNRRGFEVLPAAG